MKKKKSVGFVRAAAGSVAICRHPSSCPCYNNIIMKGTVTLLRIQSETKAMLWKVELVHLRVIKLISPFRKIIAKVGIIKYS